MKSWGGQLARVSSLLFGFLLISQSAFATQKVTLAWDRNSEPDIAGYKLYYGTATGVYNFTNVLLNVTNATVTGLKEGWTYYFVVTAYNTSGLESLPSNEVTFTADPTFKNWRTLSFSASDLADPAKETTTWGDSADPDKDGRQNLLEYALGYSPTQSSDGAQGMKTEIRRENGQPYQYFIFNRRKTESCLIYVPQVSGDNQTRYTGATYIQETGVVSINTELDSVTVKDLTPITTGNPRFFQLKVQWSVN